MNRLSIVAPFFEEADSARAFAALLDEFERRLAERHGLAIEKILVDDGSTDGGGRLFAQHLTGDWTILTLSRNFGKEVALLAGMEVATGDLVLLMDADLQHGVEVGLALIDELLADGELDVVYAVRSDRRDGGWRRNQLARAFYRLINIGQRYAIPENAGDFRVMRRPVADALVRLRDKRRFNKGLYAWAGFRQKAIGFRPAIRTGGRSKYNRLGLIAYSVEAITSFSVVPLRVFSLTGLVLALAGAAYGVKILFEVLFTGIAVPGYPSLMVAIVVLGGFNIALLGLIGEYVWAALLESKHRPNYVLREVIRSSDRPARPVARPAPGPETAMEERQH